MTEEQKQPQVNEFMETSGSPVPGITLRQVLRGHTGLINHIAWSPDGNHIASTSLDTTIRIWNIEKGECSNIFEQRAKAYCVSWSPDGKQLASGYFDVKDIRIFNIDNKNLITLDGHESAVYSVSWSPDRRKIASGSGDKTIRIWDPETKDVLISDKQNDEVFCVAWLPDGQKLVSSSKGAIYIWNSQLTKISETHLKSYENEHIYSIAFTPDSSFMAIGGSEKAIHILDIRSGKIIHLEGHTASIRHLSFSYDNKLLASKADDAVFIWRTDNWQRLAEIVEPNSDFWPGIGFHPTKPILATLGDKNQAIRIWDLENDLLFNSTTHNPIKYTTAKVVLVGDSGVGKTGLGWRLAHGEFKEHSSSHGQQFWVIPELGIKRQDGTECEAVLWDLAGQHIYRSIHSIFLENVDASLILFDPSNRQDPLKGSQFWLEQLKGKKELPPSILVGARVDRGTSILSQQELDQFCQRHGISGGYIGTSAKSGEGLDNLLERLKEQIPWEQMTTTVTTATFKRIKEYVLKLKEKPERKKVLVQPAELYQQLRVTDNDWQFTDAEMMTAVGHLENHGYLTILKNSEGEQYILLVPELLASLASSIFLHADKHPRELGALHEADLLKGKYPIDEIKDLEKDEQQVLLDAAVHRFLEHSICFRETLGNDTLLIFPSLIKQKRPLQDDHPSVDDISYIVRGKVENIYSMLVVLLGYTPSFTRINQWQNQAQYETAGGDICGFRLVEDREGEIELILYYGTNMPTNERNDFQMLFEQFLYQRDVDVTPFPIVVCPNGHPQERTIIIKRVREGKESIFCDECGANTVLPNLKAQQTIGIDTSDWLKHEEAIARLRNTYETNLVHIKGYRRGWATPRCFISYIDEQNNFAIKISQDLRAAGIFVIDEQSKVTENDTIIILNSSAYEKSWQSNALSLQEDIKLIQPRLASKKLNTLISIVAETSTPNPHDMHNCKPGDFSDKTHYIVGLFDLILNIYSIPLTHAGFIPLRQFLHSQWEQTLTSKKESDTTHKKEQEVLSDLNNCDLLILGSHHKIQLGIEIAKQFESLKIKIGIQEVESLSEIALQDGFKQILKGCKSICVILDGDYQTLFNNKSNLLLSRAVQQDILVFSIAKSDIDILELPTLIQELPIINYDPKDISFEERFRDIISYILSTRQPK